MQQQLPKDVSIKGGCWSMTPDGKLEGYFEKETTDTVYVFELRDDRWILVNIEVGAVVRNPDVLRD